ncbi:MAG TPA: oligosaccharide flippase family protein [Azonexus sp.]|nr:oligosaccharide flippase family protein [Azonexus sp.]
MIDFSMRTKCSWRPGKLARNTLLATGWQGLRLTLQFAYLVVVARLLGAVGYGTFSGIVALAATLSPLAGAGFGLILVKQVSRYPESFPRYWGKVLTATAFSAPLLILVMGTMAALMLPGTGEMIALLVVGISELLLVPLITACANAYQAHERLGASIFNFVLLNGGRLLSIGTLALYDSQPDLTLFAIAYLAGTALPTAASLTIATRTFGRPITELRGLTSEFREGLGFAASGVTGVAQAEIDKSLLLRLDGALATGTYSVATRIVSAATVPLISFVLAAVPQLFRTGTNGTGGSRQTAGTLLVPVLLYGAVAGGAIYLLAPWLPTILGDEFAGSVSVIRTLALLPSLIGISNLLLAVLSCSGAQPARVKIELLALGLGIGLNIALIPSLGVLGAVYAALASQGALAGMAILRLFAPHPYQWKRGNRS